MVNKTVHNHNTSSSDSPVDKAIFFTVTTDLSYDQRMIRICTSLSKAGYLVTLVGRKMHSSIPLLTQPFKQKRINCLFEKGKLFYAEFNIRLFFYLLVKKMDCICAIDLDTILPCYFIARIKKIKRVYDAHELFCEMEEIVSRKAIYKVWKKIEQFTVPHFLLGYTVNEPIANEFNKMYKVEYKVIKNIALLRESAFPAKKNKFILYQGAVNKGRSFETLIPAMKDVNCPLIICGDGNFMQQARELVKENKLEQKVVFKGKVTPDNLRIITQSAYIGITLFNDKALSNYYSLANRFFDYLHAVVPQVCVDYPAYREINEQIPVAILIKNISAKNLANELNNLLSNEVVYKELENNCMKARTIFNWQQEEKKLIAFYDDILRT